MFTFHFWAINAVMIVALTATIITDLRWRRIPDWITLPTALAGYALAFAAGGLGEVWHSPSLISSLVGTLIAGGFFWVVSLTGGIGMGDVKLMGALGALLGAAPVIGDVLFIALAGGVQGVMAFLAGTSPGRLLCARLGMKGTDAPEFGKTVPYGLSIAAGTVLFRLWQSVGT